MRRLSAVFAAIVLALGLGIAAATPATAVDLSDTGQAAVGDLRTCLASHDVLNAYYIIDNSQSLRVEDDGSTPGSDPEKMRAEILANSLAQLGRLGEGKTVNWAAGFFSTDFDPSIGWTPWSEDSGDRLEAAVRAKIPAGFTNWLAAMEGVQGELASQPDRGSACQLVVWFTDGAIDLAEGARATSNALNDLCGQRIDPDGHRPDGYGILNSFRQSGVVVIGTLLAQGSTRDAAEVMWPLVESSGTVGGQEASCGQPDPPENAVRGAVVDASDPDALALVFLELASQIGGGYPRPLDDEGRFWIDPGVSRFQIALGSDDWRLIPPAGSGLADITADTLGVATAEDTGGATRLEVVVDDGMHGRWQLDATDVRDVFLFSDLSIEFDEQNEVEVSDDGQIRATLNAQLVRNGTPASLEDFASREVAAWIKSADGLEPIAGAVVDPATGEIAIPLPSDVSTAQITVKASIDPLTTAEHGLSLAPVFSNEVTVATVLPANFPTITDLPVTLSDLEGADGEAHGVMTVDGPATGGDGSICLPEDPDVKSDSADRRDSWQWHVTDDLDANRCVVVEEGVRGQQIGIRVSNEVAADSEVLATLGVTFTSSSGGAVDRDVEIAFRSTHPVDAVAVGLLTLGLLLLGILLPLLALWLLNWRTTRLDIDSGIQRASFAVRIGPGGVAFVDAPASDAALGERFHYRPPQRNVRAVDDADLGRLAAHVPWFPLAEPTYRISPRAGTTIVGARTSARAASAGVRRDDGSMEFRQLPLDAFWAVTVSHAELARTARGDDVNGAAVLYHRMDPAQQDQYRARLNDIGLEGSLGEAVDRARAALTQAAATKKGASAPAAASAPGDTTPTPHRDGAPPPRGGSAPPPRDGSLPPRDGSPPPRGGTAPPPRPGSPGSPPPRPGSPPPPRGR